MSDFTPTNTYSTTNPSGDNARNPRGIISINGFQIKWYDLSITTTTFYVADSFKIELPLNGQVKDLTTEYWATSETLEVKIYIGFPSNPDSYSTADLELFLIGDVDDMMLDPASSRILISGRDYTSKFLDNKTTQKFSNQTSSQIVTTFAEQQGLKTRVTPTSTVVGTYYSQQQVMLSSEITQWDLMTFLAQQEDFVLFVDGDTLVFEPRPDDTNVKKPYVIQYVKPNEDNASPQISATSLTLSRSMTLASDAQVTVRVPFGSKTGKAFSVVAKSQKKKTPSLSGVVKPAKKVQKYSFVKQGLTREQASSYAQQRLKEITSHEIRLTANVPGENTLRKDGLIQLAGTGTTFDQYYYPDEITRRISNTDGYSMDISAKNHAAGNEVSADNNAEQP